MKYIKLSEYKPPKYFIPEIKLDFSILDDEVIVISEYQLIKNDTKSDSISLKGTNIYIDNIYLNSILLEKDNYCLTESELKIKNIHSKKNTLIIKARIKPRDNTSLLGMYESNQIITTQCEAEGFRRICFHPDRPDVLSKYTVRIEADKSKYPVLLSNGDLISNKRLNFNKHEVIWKDPFPKPSYLFALVAGNLKCINDFYITRSNKKVNIQLFVERGDEKYVSHAMNSLKRAMNWDEEKYNLEYDLSSYNIVAIRHFNMGAMENKSLNIFNSKLILSNSETSTDDELEKIEAVIAHEYFHNWTGNRVTCRDWFQLSLKEGLTVFRDQQFTSDLHDYSIKRIEDSKFLRTHQFREDAGKTSHPVKPEKYLEIDNFYTTTIYEKGSEIIRMLFTIVEDNEFKKGFQWFINKYDGKAATIDNFIDSILINNRKINIQQFMRWYSQNGTPMIDVKRNWDKENRCLKISFSQKNHNQNNKINNLPLIIPIKLAIFTDKNQSKELLFILKDKSEVLEIKNINTSFKKPVISVFRDFSAPVNWETDLTLNEQLYIIENEKDMFSIYDSIQKIYLHIISSRLYNQDANTIEDKLIDTFNSIIKEREGINFNILSEILNIPTFTELETKFDNIDPLKIYKVCDEINKKFANKLKYSLYNRFKEIEINLSKTWPQGKGERKLAETIWKLLLYTNDKKIKKEVYKYIYSENMSLSKSVMTVFQKFECEEREKALDVFFKRWKNNKIVLDNWFYQSASLEGKNSLKNLNVLFKHKLFDSKSPNTFRSILNGFVNNNRYFHNSDGSGYFYVAKKIVEFDKINPITVSRFLKAFSNWKYYKDPYKNNMLSALKLIDNNKLSFNTREIINLLLSK